MRKSEIEVYTWFIYASFDKLYYKFRLCFYYSNVYYKNKIIVKIYIYKIYIVSFNRIMHNSCVHFNILVSHLRKLLKWQSNKIYWLSVLKHVLVLTLSAHNAIFLKSFKAFELWPFGLPILSIER